MGEGEGRRREGGGEEEGGARGRRREGGGGGGREGGGGRGGREEGGKGKAVDIHILRTEREGSCVGWRLLNLRAKGFLKSNVCSKEF